MELEDEFGTEIPDEEAEKINTVGDAAKHINSLENKTTSESSTRWLRFFLKNQTKNKHMEVLM